MKEDFVVIVAAGSDACEDIFYLPFIQEASYKIAADAGLRVFSRLHLVPDLLVGDADSLTSAEWKWAKEQAIPIKKFPREKDVTDTQLALDIAIEKGKSDIRILGGIGTRLDHSLANLYLLIYGYEKNTRVSLLNPWHEVYLLSPEFPCKIKGDAGDIVSVLPATHEIHGLTLEGFHWNLTRFSLKQGLSLGISNYLEGQEGMLSLEKGLAFVMKVREK
jgi:thiamine pyrophosphokinase